MIKEKLVHSFLEKIKETEGLVLKGPAYIKNMEEYRYHLGKIEGIKICLDIFTDLLKELDYENYEN